METLLAFVVGAIFAAGVYLLLRRSAVKLVLGLALLGHAVNLLVFTAGGLGGMDPAPPALQPPRLPGKAALLAEPLGGGLPPIVPAGSDRLPKGHVDPVPQALVLTAIVIGFGVQAFALVLLKRTLQVAHTDDLDALDTTERDP